MASRARSQNDFLYPDSKEIDETKDANSLRYKQANVYDAVAGKVSSQGFISQDRLYASTRDTVSSSRTPVAPENVLFKRHDAPVRYAESDFYFANEKQEQTTLPDPDLLKALHSYSSDFYSRAVRDASSDFKSMDETALLAFGILMEENMREILGRNGDLVFTEGEEIEGQPSHNTSRGSHPGFKRPSKKRRIEN